MIFLYRPSKGRNLWMFHLSLYFSIKVHFLPTLLFILYYPIFLSKDLKALLDEGHERARIRYDALLETFSRKCIPLYLSTLQAFEELEELLGRYNICIAVKEKLVKDSGVAEEVAYDDIVSKLLTKPRARGKMKI